MRLSLGRGGRPLRIAYGRIFHEANAYSPLLTTGADFERLHHMEGDELAQACTLSGVEIKAFMPHAELTGFRQAARLAGGIETVALQSSMAVPNGPLTRETWDDLSAGMLRRIEQSLPLDGVYLALHGSMQVDGLDEAPEAHLLRRVRDLVGPRVRIAVSYDLHANLSSGLVDPVDVLIAYRTNPHWDLFPTGFRAGNRLIRVLRGEAQPLHAWRKLPMLLGGGYTIDFLPPMRGVFRAMKSLERESGVISASLFMVHPYTTAQRLGWAVHISTNNDRELADRVADRLADIVWEQRRSGPPRMYSVDEALEETSHNFMRHLGPVTFVDVDDIVGAGAPGGNTRIVESLVKNSHGLRAFVPVHDPRLIEEHWDVSNGTAREFTLRGTPGYGTPETTFRATITAHATGDCGRVLRLDTDGFHVVVTERPPLPIHPSFWSEVGLRARDADVIVQKNFFHYRMFYLTTSFSHVPVVSDGATNLVRVRELSRQMGVEPGVSLTDWRNAETRTFVPDKHSRV